MGQQEEGSKQDEPQDTSFSNLPMTGLPLAGAIFGMCLGGPVGLLAGAKLGGVAAVGGSILGYTGASVIKEQKEIRAHIDDYYMKEPELYTLTPREEVVLARRRQSERAPPESPRRFGSRRERLLVPGSPEGRWREAEREGRHQEGGEAPWGEEGREETWR